MIGYEPNDENGPQAPSPHLRCVEHADLSKREYIGGDDWLVYGAWVEWILDRKTQSR
jgi:hypothetical protein